MSRRIRIQAPGLDNLLAKLQGGAIIRDELRRAFTRSAFIVESEAKRLVPKDRGTLRANITNRIDPDLFPKWAEVGNNLAYAQAVHDGRPRGIMPPVDAIAAWVKRKRLKGDDGKPLSAWAVARSIQKSGTKPHPYLSDALEAKKGEITTEFEKSMERMQDQWGR